MTELVPGPGVKAYPRSGHRTMWDLALPLLVGCLACLAYALTRAPSFSWVSAVSDSAELSAAAAVFGVPHPTGYPLYMLLGGALTRLPLLGTPAQALTWLSVLCGAGGAALACAAALVLAPGAQGGLARLGAGAIGGLGLAALPMYWTQSTAPETRTLAMLLVLGTLLVLLRALERRDTALLPLAWGLYGLALADHLLCLALLPGLLLGTASLARRGMRAWLRALAALAPGLCLYAYLPLRAAAHPALNWGDPSTPARFWWLVSGAQYRALMGWQPAALGERLGTLAGQLGAAYLLAGVAGLGWLLWRRPLVGTVLIVTALTSLAQSALYGADAAPIYLLPCACLLCLGAGYGVSALAGSGLRAGGRAVVAVGVAAALVTMGIDVQQARALYTGPDTPLAASYARYALPGLPRGALVLATGDDDTFALWYAQAAQGLRQDVAVVNTELLAYAWYKEEVQRRYGWLRWGGVWGADSGVPHTRAAARAVALVRAMLPSRAVYWTAPFDVTPGLCGLVPTGDMFQCVR